MAKNLNFDYIEDFVDYVTERVYGDEEPIISVVAKFEEASAIIKELMRLNDDIDFENIQLTHPIINDYEGEYVMDIMLDDGETIFFGVEPAIRDGKYLNVSNDEVYIFEDCNAKLAKSCDKYSDVYIVHIGEDDRFEDEGDECECPECKARRELAERDDTEYYVNDKKVSKSEFDKCKAMIQEAKVSYGKELRDALKKHCELMDEVNDFLARL